MLLRFVSICNYRSIKNIDLDLSSIGDKNFHILIGVNETGKSNILKAISMLNNIEDIKYETDCEKTAKSKKENISLYTTYHITSNVEIAKLINNLDIIDDFKKQIKITEIRREIEIDSKNEIDDTLWLSFDKDIYKGYYYNKANIIIKSEDKFVEEGYSPLTAKQLDLILTAKISD